MCRDEDMPLSIGELRLFNFIVVGAGESTSGYLLPVTLHRVNIRIRGTRIPAGRRDTAATPYMMGILDLPNPISIRLPAADLPPTDSLLPQLPSTSASSYYDPARFHYSMNQAQTFELNANLSSPGQVGRMSQSPSDTDSTYYGEDYNGPISSQSTYPSSFSSRHQSLRMSVLR